MKTFFLFVLWVALSSLFTFVNPSFAQSGRPQKLSYPDAVPEGLSAPDWSSIHQQYEQHRHAAFPVDGGYQARNPGQQWQTRFDGRGFTVQPAPERDRSPVAARTLAMEPLGFSETVQTTRPAATGDRSRSGASAAGWQSGLELQSYGFTGSERTVSGKPHVNTLGQRVTYDWDATLQEWFVNDRHGLEHGFIVRERPHQFGSNDREVLECASPLALFSGDVQTRFSAQKPKRQRAGALQDAVATPDDSPLTFTLAVHGGLRPEVQADGLGMCFVNGQGVAVLTYAGLTVFDADGRKLPAHFEVLGSRRRESAHSFEKRDRRRLTSAATESLRLVIDECGARYPITIDPIAQQAYLKASNTGEFDCFGRSVAVSGDTIVVGAYEEDSNAMGVNGNQGNNSATASGAAYLLVRSGTNLKSTGPSQSLQHASA